MSDRASAISIEIISTRGSTPRDAGTAMKVSATTIEGTIGGGALEFSAIETARKILMLDGDERSETIPLGPNLGQCCGGTVTIRYTFTENSPSRERNNFIGHPVVTNRTQPMQLWLWGAGHVGRAVVDAADPQSFKITWIDSHATRFPSHVHENINVVSAADMPLLASRAPTNAHHLIFTYSHEIDLALCAALIKRGAASIGLIGSATKWARFSKRLRTMNLDPTLITCPIGDKSLGKRPDQIAHGTVRALLCDSQTKVSQ